MKYFEVRDRGTLIVVAAFRFVDIEHNAAANLLLMQAGYGRTAKEQSEYIAVMNITGGNCESHTDAYKWLNHRTMGTAHIYINDNFKTLKTGDVIDIEFILGETSKPKISEILEILR